MAFANGLSERMEELRFPNPRSPNDEPPYAGYTSPSRGQTSFYSSFQQPSSDARLNLQRRFTTDSSKTSMSSYGSQYSHMKSDYTSSLERKNQQIEAIRAQKRKMEAQMKLLDLQEQDLQQPPTGHEINRVASRVNRVSLTAVSEPTTPPEHADTGFGSSISRPNRYSMNNVVSLPGFSNRFSQSSSHITSPQTANLTGEAIASQTQKPPAKSMPGSRRNSDEEEYFPEELPATRSAASLNRYSMPVNSSRGQQRSSMNNPASQIGFGPLNTTSFLFDDSDEKHLSLNGVRDLDLSMPSSFMMLGSDDKFPTLRANSSSGLLSANSAALDLANSRAPEDDPDIWASGTRHRPSHQSMPHSDLNMYRPVLGSPPNERPLELVSKKPQRHSMGVTFGDSSYEQNGTLPSTTTSLSRPASLQSSYSTNDLPTVKSGNSLAATITPSKTLAEQHFHNHNASLGRIPPGAVNNRQSGEGGARLSITEPKSEDKNQNIAPNQSALQASAAPFGPQPSATVQPPNTGVANMSTGAGNFNGTQMYSYGMHAYDVNHLSTQMALNGQMQAYPVQNQANFGQFGTYGAYNRATDGLQRGSSGRRAQNGVANRFHDVPLQSFRGTLPQICRDQHGCRYLQQRLEENNPEYTQMIFAEIRPHIIDLMTDPFGNYLCQKLFEHCSEDQRTALINTAAPNLVNVALNQHGTRALQKMIEFVNTPEQVETIIQALSERVVELVQDLNGNHVVQKCLNRLGAQNSQFIYDAVGKHCVIVGTHRHGCCVLQRCIDHAAGQQRAQLIARITHNAFTLVQDPFGNYVVQYILDLDEAQFTKPLCLSFSGNVPALSKQKFSSNVIEKCLRTADFDVKRMMIDEMLLGNELEKMLRDSFANYVVQTAMDFADPETKMRLTDAIRPMLPAIKQTPHGRRIAGKILSIDGQGHGQGQARLTGNSNGQMTTSDVSSPSSFTPSRSGSLSSGRRQVQVLGGGFFTGGSVSRYNSFSPTDNLDSSIPGRPFTNANGWGNPFGESPAKNIDAFNSSMNGAQNGYSTYMGSQPGPGYI